jgi:hypothetical protein
MTLDQYKTLEKEAKEPFWVDEKGFIYIPSTSIHACLVNANDEAPSRIRIENIRRAIRTTNFTTTKKVPDGVWERFAVVKSGSGQTLSNQRGIRTSSYIKNFTATGEFEIDLEMVNPEAVKNLLDFAARNIGIGASRSMGWGRFIVDME